MFSLFNSIFPGSPACQRSKNYGRPEDYGLLALSGLSGTICHNMHWCSDHYCWWLTWIFILQMSFYYYVGAKHGGLQVLIQMFPLGMKSLVWTNSSTQTEMWQQAVIQFADDDPFQVCTFNTFSSYMGNVMLCWIFIGCCCNMYFIIAWSNVSLPCGFKTLLHASPSCPSPLRWTVLVKCFCRKLSDE